MSTQQDIYAAGFENRPPMLNKENYVSWSSRLLRYAKSRPNGKLIHNFIINGPYVRRMIPEPGDPNREVPMNETFHVQTDDELTEKELKQIKADDQAIQTILAGLPEDIYAVVDSCETAQEIWLRVQQMMKGSKIGIQEKKAKLFNEWERFTSTDGESIESYYHRFLKLMNDLKRYKHFPEKIAYITDLTTAMNMALALMDKAFKLNYSTPTNNYQRIASNPRNRQIAQPGMNMGQDRQMQMVGGNGGNQFRQYAGQNGMLNQNPNGNVNLVAAHVEDLDEIEEVNANCILMANLQQASTWGTQTDKAPVYDSDGSAEINALHLSSGKQIMALNEEISDLKKQLSVEKSTVSSLLKEKKTLKSDFKIREDELLDKQIQLEKNIKELDNILVKMDNTKTRRPQPRSNTKKDRAPSASKSSRSKNKEVKVEEHHRKLLLSRNKKHMSSECNNAKLATQNVKSKVFVLCSGRNTCFVRNLEGVDLLSENQTTNLYTINLHEMASASPICLMARATSTKSWLWHQRLSHLNFDTINDLAKNDLVFGLPKFKFHKEHRCPSFEQKKSKRASHPPKPVPNSRQRLHLVHMDLCGPMRIASINGSVERRNWTLVKAARTMLIFSRAPLFLWAEAIATAALCYPKNDREDIGKLGAKGDIGFFIGYSADSCAFRVYNRRIKKIMKTMNVSFDELSVMAFEQRSSKPKLQSMTSGQISSGLDLTYAPSTITTQQPTEVSVAHAHQVRQAPTTSTSIANTTSTPTNSSSQATNFPNTSRDVDELNSQQQHAQQQGN
nr:integrase, catalytic region, zinc finger, CCHC-type, peptidase aspartic, catalytic [Tanacetum cinerariifolium]